MNGSACGFGAVEYADNADNITANLNAVAFLYISRISDNIIPGYGIYVQNLLSKTDCRRYSQPAAIYTMYQPLKR